MSSIAPAPELPSKQTPSRSSKLSPTSTPGRGGGGGATAGLSAAAAPPPPPTPGAAAVASSSSASGEAALAPFGAAIRDGDNDALLTSITQRQSVLTQPLVTMTLYIPTSCVGAVIGRRGQAIAHVQKVAGQAATTSHPVRVSVIGGESNPLDSSSSSSSLPYTYSDLDFSDPNWTPVVIRADPKAAFTAASKVEEILTANDSVMDDVVLDVPLGRQKHAAVVGKRGFVLANLSADTQVRVMVPNKDRRHDVVQLEGELSNVKMCLERVLIIASKPSSGGSGAGAAVGTRNDAPAGGGATTAASSSSSSSPPGSSSHHVQTLVVDTVPSQTKIRGLCRKTDTVIKKKRVEVPPGEGGGGGAWQLTVTGSSAEQVQAAIHLLQKVSEGNPHQATTSSSNEASGNAAGGGGGVGGGNRGGASGNASPAATGASAPRRGRTRGRAGAGSGGKGSAAAAPPARRRGSGSNRAADHQPAAASSSASA